MRNSSVTDSSTDNCVEQKHKSCGLEDTPLDVVLNEGSIERDMNILCMQVSRRALHEQYKNRVRHGFGYNNSPYWFLRSGRKGWEMYLMENQ